MGLFSKKKDLASSFSSCAQSFFDSNNGVASRLLHCYDITPELDDQTALLRLLQFGSDIGHQAASLALAEKVPGDAFVLEFSEPNPWDGPFKGHSNHILDISFLLQNFNEHLNATQKASAVQFAKDVIAFAHGEEPWKPFSASRGIAKLHGGQRQYFEGPEATSTRFQEMVDIGKLVGLDTLSGLWASFAFGG